jgi:hypothetical protein
MSKKPTPTPKPKPLDVEVRDMLEDRRGDWTSIAVSAGISHSWISKFVRGEIPNPGFVTLSNLRKYLVGKPVKQS